MSQNNYQGDYRDKPESFIGQAYPGLDFRFNINDLPKDYLDRLGHCVSLCERITALVVKYKIFKKPFLHLTMFSDPMSDIWLNPSADKDLKEKYRAFKARNISAIYNDLALKAERGEKIPITIDDLFKYHERLFLDIPQHPQRPCGQYRQEGMKVVKEGKDIFIGTSPEEVPAYMEKLFYWLDSKSFESKKGTVLGNAFIKAIVGHMYFISIHPFYDGNGTLARFLQYAILRHAGVPAQIAHLLANYYNETREDYCHFLNRARQSGDVTFFLDYAFQGLSHKLNVYLEDLLKNFSAIIRDEIKEDKFILVKGFTIIEILVVLAVVAILVGTAVPKIKGMQDQAGLTRAKSDLKTLQTGMEGYKMQFQSYPSTMYRLVTTNPQLLRLANLKDPWGHSYRFFNIGSNAQYYLIYSQGPVTSLTGGSCFIGLDTPTGTPYKPAGCRSAFVTNAPVATFVPEDR